MKRSQVTKANEAKVWDTLYGNDVDKRVRFKLQVGDRGMKDILKANTYLLKIRSVSPEEREEIERNKQLSSYSRAFAQDVRRSKCIAMLNKIRSQDLPVCSN